MIERTYRISDVVNDEFLRFPLTLLANPKYKEMSLEAKFIYSLLLGRLTLSQKNGWINEDNEVYLIYTREDAANILNISYKKTIAAFRELIDKGLLYEKRQGRGYPNLLYVLKAELNDTQAAEFSEEYNQTAEDAESKEAVMPLDSQNCQSGTSRHAKTAGQDMSKSHIKNCQNDRSGTADMEDQELPVRQPRKTENIYNNISYPENSPSVCHARTDKKTQDGQTDADNEVLETVFDRCELGIFQPNIRAMIRNAIERLYYSETVKIGNARLPQAKVRSYLNLLESDSVIAAIESMKKNEEHIVNPTAYLMSTLFNSICEKDSGLILRLPPEYLNSEDLYMPANGLWEEVEDNAPE